MNFVTPFSGLSLIIHLVIIGFVTLFKLIVRYGKKFRIANFFFISRVLPRRLRKAFLFFSPALSVFIITFVAGAVLFSMIIAVQTGVREGSSEPSRRFVYRQYSYLSKTAQGLVQQNSLLETTPVIVSNLATQGDIFVPVAKKKVSPVEYYDFSKLPNPPSFPFAEIRMNLISY